jgi:hypothetical protein
LAKIPAVTGLLNRPQSYKEFGMWRNWWSDKSPSYLTAVYTVLCKSKNEANIPDEESLNQGSILQNFISTKIILDQFSLSSLGQSFAPKTTD